MNKLSENVNPWYSRASDYAIDYAKKHPYKTAAGVIGSGALLYGATSRFLRDHSPRRKVPKDILYVEPDEVDLALLNQSIKSGMYKNAGGVGAFLGGAASSFDDIVAYWQKYFGARGGFGNWLKGLRQKYIYDPATKAYKWVDEAGANAVKKTQQELEQAHNIRMQGSNAPAPPQPKQTWWQWATGQQPAAPVQTPTAPISATDARIANFGKQWGIPIAAGTTIAGAGAYGLYNSKVNAANRSQLGYSTAPSLDQPPAPYMDKFSMYNPYLNKHYMYKSANVGKVVGWLGKHIGQFPGSMVQRGRNLSSIVSNGWNGKLLKGYAPNGVPIFEDVGKEGINGVLGVLENGARRIGYGGQNAWKGMQNWYARNAAAGGGGFGGFVKSVTSPAQESVNAAATNAQNAGLGMYNYFGNLFTGNGKLYNRLTDAPSQMLSNAKTGVGNWWNNVAEEAKRGWNTGRANSAAMWNAQPQLVPKTASYRVRIVSSFLK